MYLWHSCDMLRPELPEVRSFTIERLHAMFITVKYINQISYNLNIEIIFAK